MTESCPVEGCARNCRDIEGLYGHLYIHHNKSELIKTLLRLLKKT